MIKYRDSEGLYVGLPEAAFCTARSQLLMNLHDAGIAEISSQVLEGPLHLDFATALKKPKSVLCAGDHCLALQQTARLLHAIIMWFWNCFLPLMKWRVRGLGMAVRIPELAVPHVHVQSTHGRPWSAVQDPVHKLAWTLDACINDRSLDSRRLRELQNFFAPHDTAGAMPPPADRADRKAAQAQVRPSLAWRLPSMTTLAFGMATVAGAPVPDMTMEARLLC